MKDFTRLFEELDSTTSTLEKVAALKKYFKTAMTADASWAVMLLTGRISKRAITSKVLRDLFLHKTKYPEWLFEECYSQVGDTAETLSLLLQSLDLAKKDEITDQSFHKPLTQWLETEIPKLAKIKDQDLKADKLFSYWQSLVPAEIFILNKLMTGSFRVGVSEKLVLRALSEVFNVRTDILSHRMTALQDPTVENFQKLISQEKTEVLPNQPYPFCLAHAWAERKENDWVPERWAIEWKFDGIRSQVIKRLDNVWIWSRGEDDISASFPDIKNLLSNLPDGTVIDGEIVVILENEIRSFQDLQKRLGRKKVSAVTLKDYPAGFIAYDCLEINGNDIRDLPYWQRRQHLEEVITPYLSSNIRLSQILKASSLDELENLREHSRKKDAEGVMLKDIDSPYLVGRKTGYWWKHKVDPLTLDAVLLYAQAGTGRRANLYTDYTFALWNDQGLLVPFAKAYSGLNQSEVDELDAWIRRHTKEKFGPVRSLEPFHVFEIGFEGILESKRHKSGIAVRFPRILRWRKDKKFEEADTLETALKLLKPAKDKPKKKSQLSEVRL